MRFYLLIIICVGMVGCSSVTKVKTFHENGNVNEEFFVLKKEVDVKEGLYKRYDEAEVLQESINFSNGIVNGERSLYYPNGQVMISESYIEGYFSGPYRSFFESGNKNEEGRYSENQMVGEWKFYFDLPENPLKESVQFVDNVENGPFREYHENGQLKAEGTYKDEFEDGLFREYDDRGNLIKEIEYQDGRLTTYKEFDANGNLVKESDYSDSE